MNNSTKSSSESPINPVQSPSLSAWLLLALLATIWGSSFILMKKSLVVFSPDQVGSMRIFAAFLFFLPVLLSQFKKIPKDKWLYFFLSGMLGSMLPALLFSVAGKHLDSGISGALNSTTPLFTLIVGALFFEQVIRKRQIWGIFLGFCGSLILIFANKSGGISVNGYAFLVILATVMYGFNLNIIKKYLNNVPALIVTACVLASTGPIATAILFSGDFMEKAQTPEALIPLTFSIILGVVGTGIATVLFNRVLQMTTAVFSSSVTYLIPIVAVIWGILDGETISIWQILGMVIILFGVYLVNSKGKEVQRS
jgi:drug/metabolite transporter (DMT)-like permease